MSLPPDFHRILDGMTVGLSISESTNSGDLGFSSHEINRLVAQVAETLLGHGARLVVGFNWRRDGVMTAIHRSAILYRSADRPMIVNFLAWPDEPGLSKKERDELSSTVEIREVGLPPDLKSHEKRRKHPPDPWLRARALTYMRRQIIDTVDAQICVGGKTESAAGRLPGVVEEIYLLTRAGKAVYLSGLIGGATREIINVLRRKPYDTSIFLTNPAVREAYRKHSKLGDDPDARPDDPDARLDPEAIRQYFTDELDRETLCKANRLDLAENDQLYDAFTMDDMMAIVVRGLRRISNDRRRAD